ncbi:endonuclease [Mycobacterium sp. CBMA271]|uniref:Z1 domain-containing protein n=1 Tax=unclassified Mycobacteroides TaxID=2618759 RepID=UPI0012DF727B|nr:MULTISPECIES: Z1 domain-containing protein [unclassified Mycobacteroides]MUM19653.1 hypothetical protein [Mycobacteroides sp. CBMA 326]MUM24255.1 endonuclease [Mycobacteroides sp. CBMA 271]
MTSDWLKIAFLQQLKAIAGDRPKNLIARVQAEASDHDTQVDASDLTKLIMQSAATDPFLTALGLQVHKWDASAATVDWTKGTEPSTAARRALICIQLGIDTAGAGALLQRRPVYVDRTIVVTAPWEKWYTPQRASAGSFYWPHYRDYLLSVREWPEKSVTALDLATDRVVERLADPSRVEAYQAKGLVVGYVQSGKTANFTGVIAKAIDVGYRLVIVMTGTIEMLRGQTQRRIDMELVGKQNIIGDLTPEEALAAHIDYQDDPDWDGRFQNFRGDAVMHSINRLTRHKRDYQDQFMNLKIERFDVSKPLYDPVNLLPTAARLVVTKKNSTVLEKLVANVKANKKAFAEVPVLIIDDESDQASVNTVNPETMKTGEIERRAINKRIAEMLELMPRAQYVGYTATPFANVFVDPSDPSGIYPKDFLISLPRPVDYMGVEDFHDLHPVEESKTVVLTNYEAYVRDLKASERPDDEEERDAELRQALDMFVLTGACKLYRAAQTGAAEFKHHTMLVHESVRNRPQKDLADSVQRVWAKAGFTTPGGMKRLRELYSTDVLVVSKARCESGVPVLPEFEHLKPYIAKAIARITEHNNNPVLIVNSDVQIQQQQQELDFDRNSTWRVLVGGAKLSRGFTVEGLTVTYFRRTVKMSDSLTQMGRWFGFRHGYRDLVRLYIDRDAKFTAKQRVDLYAAFEAIARDEAAFREQLAQYAEWDGDKPRVLPSQIPPLVSQHLPWLKPTASNKMFNAVLQEQSDRVLSPSGYPFRLSDQRHNLDLWRPTLAQCDTDRAFPAGGAGSLRAFSGVVEVKDLLTVINQMKWMYEYERLFVRPRVTFIRRLARMNESPLKDLLVILPQPGKQSLDIGKVGSRRIVNRDRRARGGDLVQKFGEITDPKHRHFISPLLGSETPVGHPLKELWTPTRGVGLVYLVKEQNPQFELDASRKSPPGLSPEKGTILAFSLYLPHGAAGYDDGVPKFSAVMCGHTSATVDVAKAARPDSGPSGQ